MKQRPHQPLKKLVTSIQAGLISKGFSRYFFNTGWLMAEKVLRLVVGLFVGVYVARYLGPAKFGILNFAMSFVALFGAFAKLGLDGIVVRNALQSPERRDDLLGTSFGLRIIGGLLLLGLVFFAIRATESDPITRLIVMIITAGHVLQAFEVIEFYFHSQVMGRAVAISGIVSLIISSVVKLSLIWSEASLIWFAWVFVIEIGIKGIALSILYLQQRIPLWRWRFHIKYARLLMRDSWPLMLSGLVIMVYMRIDQVMIKLMLNNEAVGNYAAAVRLSEAWYFVPMIITQSLFPAIISAKNQGEKVYYARLQRLYDFGVWLGIGVALPITFLSDSIVTVLYGQEYGQAADVLSIHVWAGVFVFLGLASGKWLLAENYMKQNFYRTAFGMLVNVSFNFILIPKYGIFGAAIATLLGQMSANLLYDLLDKRAYPSLRLKMNSLIPVSYLRKRSQTNIFSRT